MPSVAHDIIDDWWAEMLIDNKEFQYGVSNDLGNLQRLEMIAFYAIGQYGLEHIGCGEFIVAILNYWT